MRRVQNRGVLPRLRGRGEQSEIVTSCSSRAVLYRLRTRPKLEISRRSRRTPAQGLNPTVRYRA